MRPHLRKTLYKGPVITDRCTFDKLPNALQRRLEELNGCVILGGGLHVRGACHIPIWHSMGHLMTGSCALHTLFEAAEESDIPFAQDCLGDQFILRGGIVHRLYAEKGEGQTLRMDLTDFLEHIDADPVGFLQLQPLILFHNEGGILKPGQSLMVYPPYCFRESASGVSISAIDTLQLLLAHARLARVISGLMPGQKIDILDVFREFKPE
jgi:hypothetical protein